ncbi:helix-turn-helix domain-containing protein [Chitinibacter tainanensis]|uniref:helix-turn-helix domain-containing protein n=1 Tax=Chitinibacter tainanensis TaxID=230667 RepID=UPI0004913CFF|nr:helix-turn-helix domain-containing protein [Chitinibacter tainanensis]
MTEQEQAIPASSGAMPAGQQLRSAREGRGWSVEDVAGQLKLSARQIVALEEERFTDLPGNLFIRGFVRNYARLLGLDSEPLLQYLAGVLPADVAKTPVSSVNVQVDQPVTIKTASRGPSATVIMALLGVFIGVGGVYWYLQQPGSPELDLPTIPTPAVVEASAASAVEAVASEASAVVPELVATPASAASAAVALASKASSVASAASSVAVSGPELVIVTESDSWVQVVDASGNKVLSEIVRPGYERRVAVQPPLSIRVGNAPKTRLSLRGQAVDLAPFMKPGSDVVNMELK